MSSRERVQAVIDRVRPLLQADGGDVELVDISGATAKVRFTGNCVGCPSAFVTLHLGLETAVREELPEIERLVLV
jgi:Fe-S cluster biogenesis protein NfuA